MNLSPWRREEVAQWSRTNNQRSSVRVLWNFKKFDTLTDAIFFLVLLSGSCFCWIMRVKTESLLEASNSPEPLRYFHQRHFARIHADRVRWFEWIKLPLSTGKACIAEVFESGLYWRIPRFLLVARKFEHRGSSCETRLRVVSRLDRVICEHRILFGSGRRKRKKFFCVSVRDLF